MQLLSAHRDDRVETSPVAPCGLDPVTLRAFAQACADSQADAVERLALCQAAVVARGRRQDPGERAERLGALGQNRTWGAAAARRDPYTAAMVFLKEARRLHPGAASPRRAAGLAASVQGEKAWRYAMARADAERIVEHIQAFEREGVLRGC